MNRKVPQWELERRKPNKYPNGYFKVKPCRYCGLEFQPIAPSHHFCCDDCKAIGSADRYYRKSYNIGFDEIQSMLIKQDYLCAICREEGFKMNDKVYNNLNVDHCHSTGQVRGLLCHNCNRALGLLKDNIERLKSAITYLEGATTISKESTDEAVGKRTTSTKE
jgi:hypothetical protein